MEEANTSETMMYLYITVLNTMYIFTMKSTNITATLLQRFRKIYFLFLYLFIFYIHQEEIIYISIIQAGCFALVLEISVTESCHCIQLLDSTVC